MSLRAQYWLLGIAAALLFLPFLGHVHLFDWDEINFAECAREMIVQKDYLRMQIDFAPFYEKPPLFIWLQVLSMKAFGVNEYAARFPDALAGIATLVTLFHVGRKTTNEQTGRWWAILYAATWLPHIYFKSGIIDPVFNFFIFVSFYQVWADEAWSAKIAACRAGRAFSRLSRDDQRPGGANRGRAFAGSFCRFLAAACVATDGCTSSCSSSLRWQLHRSGLQ